MQYGALSLFLFRDFVNYQARNLNFYYFVRSLTKCIYTENDLECLEYHFR